MEDLILKAKRVYCGTALLALILPTAAWANNNGTATLNAGQSFSFDSGSVVSSGGDITFAGTSITVVGTASLYSAGAEGMTGYNALNSQQALSGLYSVGLFNQVPISGAALAVNEVFAVHTNEGNLAAALVTAVSSSAITFQYATYGSTTSGGGGGGGAAPTISSLLNNYSYTLPGLPNYGIAPGSIFVIFGTNLNSQAFSGLQSTASPGLQTSLNGTSISVTVNGVTTQPYIYYTSATQVAAVLPSTTPVGTGTITVTNNGQPSAAAQIQVVQSAVGILTQNQGGTGQAVVEDPSNNYSNFSFTNAVKPGQLIALWGSGVGGDTNDNDRLYPQSQDNLTNIPTQIYIGGISATITYRGRSQFPGLDQIFVTVPAGVTPGCAVSLVISSGSTSLTSNSISIPVAQNGGACSDSFSPFTATLLETLSGKTTVNVGFLEAGQITEPSTAGGSPSTTSTALGVFYSYSQAQFDGAQAKIPSLGSCVIVPPTTSSTVLPTGLDAGSTITLAGPTGQVSLTRNPVVAGFYGPGSAIASSFFPSMGGTFTFTGTGGANVGAFTASASLASPLVWTNASSTSTVNRANGVTVTWSGGAPNSYVLIFGSSSTSVSFQATPLTVTFDCIAAASAGTFTVPPAVLQSLPAASAGGLTPPSLTVENTADPVLFSASGLDLGYVTSFVYDEIYVSYQ
ncbi:MAG TPA: hypothetical protein VIY49_29170 [Bryobacteraceae bacterium]